MPRKKKIEQETLSEKQVNDVLNAYDYFMNFSDSYNRSYYSGGADYNTPDTINRRLKDINLTQVDTTVADIEKALKNAKDSEEILSNYAQTLEITNMSFKRLTQYLPNLAAFNLTFDPINVTKESELKSKEFKEDLAKVDEFCNKFDYRTEFATAMRQCFRQGAMFSVLRDEGDKYTLQELPKQFCKITGRFDYGYLYDFDMTWFLNMDGVDIDMYPTIFKRMLNRIQKSHNKPYDPARRLQSRNTGFNYWQQTSPENGFWCFKLDPELATILPYYSGILGNASFQPVVRGLQQDKYFIDASKILVGILGFNKEQKSGQVANSINMTPEMIGKFLGVARKGLNSQIGLAVLPTDDVKAVDFSVSNTNSDVDYASSVVKQSVASSEALFGTEKLNSHQSKLASQIDNNTIEALYPMFANFMEFFINRMTEKYKFKVRFHDENVPDQKAERKALFNDFSKIGFVDMQLAARCNDMNVFEYTRHLQISKNCFDVKGMVIPLNQYLTPPVQTRTGTSTTTKPPENPLTKGSVGRPPKPESDSESTEASWARGSNELKQEFND